MIEIIRVNRKLEVAVGLVVNDLQAVIVFFTALYIANITCIIITTCIIKRIIITTCSRIVLLRISLLSLLNLS